MKLQKYIDFLKPKSSDIKYIEGVCRKYNIKDFKINPDNSVDAYQDVRLYHNIKDIKLVRIPIKFNYVDGSFICAENALTTLEGCPKTVMGDFNCSDNKLTSLEFCPEDIGKRFSFVRNKIISLDFFPKTCSMFNFMNNPIEEFLWIFAGRPEDQPFPVNIDVINHLMEYDVIQDNTIIKDRLEAMVDDLHLDIDMEKIKSLKNYTLI